MILQGNLRLQSNIANNRARTKQRRSKQAAKSIYMNVEWAEGNIYRRICINFCVHHNYLLWIVKCKRKSILTPTYSTILIFRLQPAIIYYWQYKESYFVRRQCVNIWKSVYWWKRHWALYIFILYVKSTCLISLTQLQIWTLPVSWFRGSNAATIIDGWLFI